MILLLLSDILCCCCCQIYYDVAAVRRIEPHDAGFDDRFCESGMWSLYQFIYNDQPEICIYLYSCLRFLKLPLYLHSFPGGKAPTSRATRATLTIMHFLLEIKTRTALDFLLEIKRWCFLLRSVFIVLIAFRTAAKLISFLISQVLVGDSFQCPADKSLKMPPVKVAVAAAAAAAGVLERCGHFPTVTQCYLRMFILNSFYI
jgi:hypothetical protein